MISDAVKLTSALEDHQAGRLQEAEQSYRDILANNPNHVDAWHLLGVLAYQRGKCEMSAEYIGRALELSPDFVEAHFNLGKALKDQGKLEQAIACYRRAIDLNPDYADAYNNLGNALQDQGNVEKAVEVYRRALDLSPDLAQAHNNLGNALREMGKDEQAMACYRRALELKPTYAEAHNHLGNLLQQQRQLEQAEMHYRRALEFKPNYGEAHFNRSLLMLLSGQFQDGWREYEWRWKAGQVPERPFSQPRWDGRSLGDRPILLYAEQGLGDTIQFARYAALVKSRRAKVWLECPASLVPLMATCHGVARVIGDGVELPPFEAQAPLLSLPGIFGTTLETIPAEVPYLFADPAIVEEWRSKLQHIRGYRVGINWHGRGTQHVLRERHIELDFFSLLAQVPDVQLISLQHGEGRKEMGTVGDRFALVDPGDDFDNTRGAFMDTAAMMMNLDLVITSDTAIAHLAGALGVPVWVALPYAPDWRWLLDRKDSPWYPTMRLFRQENPKDWTGPFAEMRKELRDKVQSGAATRTVGFHQDSFGYALHGQTADSFFNLGMLFKRRGKFERAIHCYRQVLTLNPEYAEAHNNLGVTLQQLGKLDEALVSYQRAIDINPDYAEAQNNWGVALIQRGRRKEALVHFRQAVEVNPSYAEAHNNLGMALKDDQDLAGAIDHFQLAAQSKPSFFDAHFNLGVALQEQRELEEAIVSYQRAIQLSPDHAEVHNNLGAALNELNRLPDAIRSYQKAIALKPDLAEAHNNLGVAFERQGRFTEALECFRSAVRIKPTYSDAHNNFAVAQHRLGCFQEAIASYRQALQFNPEYAQASYNLGVALQELGQFDEAVVCHHRAAELGYGAALSALIHQKQILCVWNDLAALSDQLLAKVESGGEAAPFTVISLATPTTAAQQLKCAQRQAEQCSKFGGSLVQQSAALRHARPRITVGYLSGDFREHPVSSLIAEVIERHDRKKFNIVGYSYGRDDGSSMRQRLRRGFDQFVDIRDLSFRQSAERVATDAVDILVDLTGYTLGQRTEILALRPAPIQVNYLGYPGTLGASFIDYIVVDDFVVPSDQQSFFAEKLVHLPGCYQANDSQRAIAPTPSRSECGLPPDGFVFCCFNNSFKITPEMFDVWMRLLKAVPQSVLWLLQANRFVPENLQREARDRGVSPDRIVFEPRRPLAEHLARYRLADLFLDTFPYTAHTTGSDTLWAGCPLLTMTGQTFASRVAGSLLRAVGLPELITTNINSYYNTALQLAQDRDQISSLRKRLTANRATSSLFDGGRFARKLERAYTTMWEIRTSGEQPRAFAVSPT